MGAKRTRKRASVSRGGSGGTRKRSKRGGKAVEEVGIAAEEVDVAAGVDVAEEEEDVCEPLLVTLGEGRRHKAVDWKSQRYFPGEHVIREDADGREWVTRIERIWVSTQGVSYFQYIRYWRPNDIRRTHPGFDFDAAKHHPLHECFVTDYAEIATVDTIVRKALVLNPDDFRKAYPGLSKKHRAKPFDVFFCMRKFYPIPPPALRTQDLLLFPGDQITEQLLEQAGLPRDYYEQRNIVEDDRAQRYNSQNSDPNSGLSII